MNDILTQVQQRVEQEYLQRFRRDIREIEHLRYVSVLPARPRLVRQTVEGDIGECTVCQEYFKEGEKFVTLQCNPTRPHKFHRHCIVPWLQHHDTCPTCRGRV